MGKQSSGKSYLLNHLSESLLDVAGGRCTDGVWMTITTCENGDGQGDSRYLYVLLDFDGLGSFERSEQEDMLLSVLNAAVSNFTLFNKKDFHLDKDTESAFSRFQNGINLLKQDKNLFKEWHQKRLSNQSEVMKSEAIMNANNNDQKRPKLEDFLGGAFVGVQFSDDAETHHIHTSELDQIYGKAPAPAFSRDSDHSSAMNTSIVGDHMHVNGFSDLTSDSSKHSQYQSDQAHASTAMQDIYNNNGDQAYNMFSDCSLQLSQSSYMN
ncbi:hypothetical protein KI387_032736 [Taxus chinensis]|uniref:Uncharacterized protein n=2 Tax=Taxus chinensis TaxID=29808 RepID=A0AA38C256_TAXCH|nr:hypothetical protein KI387_032736 [Taxus chinensis]